MKLKKLWRLLRINVLNKDMLLWLIIAELIFWSPCIVTGFLAITVSSWWWTAFGAVIVFWSAPLTPAVVYQIALALLLKRIFVKTPYEKLLKELKRNGRNKIHR